MQAVEVCTKRTAAYNIGVQAMGADSGKPLFFVQKLNFSSRRQQPKMKKNLYLLDEKNGIHSV